MEAGNFTDSEIVVMLGENGTGKTTFIRMLAGMLDPDNKAEIEDQLVAYNVSYKPQKISPKFTSTVRALWLAFLCSYQTVYQTSKLPPSTCPTSPARNPALR